MIEQLCACQKIEASELLVDGNDPAGSSHSVSGTLGRPDKSQWMTATALLRCVATVNPLAEMPPQNEPWLGGREGP
jgi:hypothetical protein